MFGFGLAEVLIILLLLVAAGVGLALLRALTARKDDRLPDE